MAGSERRRRKKRQEGRKICKKIIFDLASRLASVDSVTSLMQVVLFPIAYRKPNSDSDHTSSSTSAHKFNSKTMAEDDSIPEPILKLRKKSAATHLRNFDSSGEERANNNDRKRPHEESNNVGNGSKLLCQEIGLESNQDPPARERPAVCILVSFASYIMSTSCTYFSHCRQIKGRELATTRVTQLYPLPCFLWQWIYNT